VLNLLHLLAALTIAACLYALWREARGVSQSRGHLMVPPPLAFGCALLMIGLTEPDRQQPDALRIAIAAGILLGTARGWFMAVDVDPLWSTVRLPSGSDGFWLAILLAFAVICRRAAGLDAGPVVRALRRDRRGIRRRLPVGAGRDGLSAHAELTFPVSLRLLH
jgi:hypothetical protein